MELTLEDKLQIDEALQESLQKLNRKIVVLDDDPTGTQTVNSVWVYTDWEQATLQEGFENDNNMFFILTNSRSFSKNKTISVHNQIAENIIHASQNTGKDFLIISRGDSTLRGHYPIETQSLKEHIESKTPRVYDGEIIMPFFEEGGRCTKDNIHYVKVGEELVPVSDTEFAKDKTFGFQSSNLAMWCAEKTQQQYKSEDMMTFSIEELRSLDYEGLTKKLMRIKDFNKVIVNAIDLVDVKIFAIALVDAILQGKEFILRTAASMAKVMGSIIDKPLLKRDDVVVRDNVNGGMIVVGSHVSKTTKQLEALNKSHTALEYIEFNVHVIYSKEETEAEIGRILTLVEEKIKAGKNVVLYTTRKLIQTDTENKEEILKVSTHVSHALTTIVARLTIQPKFMIAKGGITSSDVGTKGLKVKKAWVLGQVAKGIPVWKIGEESKFPSMAYIIFPGNVGETETLKDIVEELGRI